MAEALAQFKQQGVDRILCLGDIAGYGNDLESTVALLREHDCQAVLGNHERWYLEKPEEAQDIPVKRWFATLPRVLQWTIEGRRLYMVHASPPDSDLEGIKLLDLNGNVLPEEKARWTYRLRSFQHDVLLVGHTHQVFCEQLGPAFVINPGSTKFNHACAILSLPYMQLTVFALSGKPVVKAWNWGTNHKWTPQQKR